MRNTHRAKELYPICLRQIFKAAMLDYNDYDTGMVRIKTNPWPKVKIPKADRPEKLAISPEECRAFFAAPLPESMFREPLAEMGRDVAMMVLCLGGINTVDLYNLKKRDYKNGVLCYKRAKTRKARNDDAYMEMRVPEILKPLMEKYADTKGGEHLFVFHRRHSTSDSFCANVNIGIKQICRSMGMAKDDFYSAYTFRHTWGTIAQNDCGANIHDVAFAMNHTSGFRVTRGYIKIDFTPAWELNEKVVEFIFFTDKKSSRAVKDEEPAQLRISPRFMVYGAAYHMGRKVAEVTDIGFRNKDEVIARLAGMLPEDIPERSIVIFKVVNMDKDQTAVYQKQKGKGF
jgi:integrase